MRRRAPIAAVAVVALLLLQASDGVDAIPLAMQSSQQILWQLSRPGPGGAPPAYWMSYECSSLDGPQCDLAHRPPTVRRPPPRAYFDAIAAAADLVRTLIDNPSVSADALDVVLRAVFGTTIDEFSDLVGGDDRTDVAVPQFAITPPKTAEQCDGNGEQDDGANSGAQDDLVLEVAFSRSVHV